MINVFITDLKKFNSGELYGDWFNLPVDKEDLEKELSKYNNNVFISDYEVEEKVKGIFDIKEYTNLYILNNALNNIAELQDHEIKQVNALVEFNYINDIYALDLYDLKREIEKIWTFEIEEFNNCSDNENLAYSYIDIMGGIDILDMNTLKKYFDYEQFGRDLSINAHISSNNICILN